MQQAMTQSERKELAKALAATALYYSRQLTPDVLAMMCDDLGDLPYRPTMAALKAYRLDAKNRAFPMPAQIRALVEPEKNISERDIANDLARKIDAAVVRHGWTWSNGCWGTSGEQYWWGANQRWPSFKEAVIAELGDIGWAVICDRGGWQRVRDSANEMDEGQFIAQARDHVESMLRLKRSGVDVSRMALPGSEQSGGSSRLTPAGDILKLIEAKRPEGM